MIRRRLKQQKGRVVKRKLALISILTATILATMATPTLARDNQSKPHHRECYTVHVDRHGREVSPKRAHHTERRCVTRPGWAKGHNKNKDHAHKGDRDHRHDRDRHDRDRHDRDRHDRDRRDHDRKKSEHRKNGSGSGCPPVATYRDNNIIRDVRGCGPNR